jgi:hypothetical protein
MKPKPATRGPVSHTNGVQPWTRSRTARAAEIATAAAERVGIALDLQRPCAGEYHLIAGIPPGRETDARAVAVAVSLSIPETWFVLGPLFVKGGLFFRRRRSLRLELVRASDVRVPRGLREKIRDLL